MSKIRGKKVAGTRGIYRLTDGRFLVRVQKLDPRTGRPMDTERLLSTVEAPDKDAAIAEQAKLRGEFAAIVQGVTSTGPLPRFRDYAEAVITRRRVAGTIRSNATVRRYARELRVINATFGDFYLDRIDRSAVGLWRDDLGARVLAKSMAPWTARGFWQTFGSIIRDGAAEFGFADPTARVKGIDLSLRKTYTPASPNALTPPAVARFFAACLVVAPEHFAILALGLLTGRRPSELRALRWGGADPDLDLAAGVLHIRRSQTYGAPMEGTKTGRDCTIGLSDDLTAVLRAHVEGLQGAARASGLVFPNPDGGYLSEKRLAGATARVAARAGITFKLTPRFMRRTVQDLARLARVDRLVLTSMTGHKIRDMADWYASVSLDEQRKALASMAALGSVFPSQVAEPAGMVPEVRRAA